MSRYEAASESPPRILYTDRDCCKSGNCDDSKYKDLFYRWTALHVRLDIWQFMRRLAVGCTNESHPLYPTFMSRLSACIFEWDKEDMDLVLKAKPAELVAAGITEPSEAAVRSSVSKDEMARNYKRRTRGATATVALIDLLISSMSRATDTTGVPILRPDMPEMWGVEKIHVPRILDVAGQVVQCYKVLRKAGIELPVFRCARGTTSLENILLLFPPCSIGASANALHFQAYLLDFVVRWNAARAAEATDAPRTQYRTFNFNSAAESTQALQTSFQPSEQTGAALPASSVVPRTSKSTHAGFKLAPPQKIQVASTYRRRGLAEAPCKRWTGTGLAKRYFTTTEDRTWCRAGSSLTSSNSRDRRDHPAGKVTTGFNVASHGRDGNAYIAYRHGADMGRRKKARVAQIGRAGGTT